jgi:hypothetical protein
MAKARAAAQCRESCGPGVPRFSRTSARLRLAARGPRNTEPIGISAHFRC